MAIKHATLPSIQTVISDPSTSYFLRQILQRGLDRDALDVTLDLELAAKLYRERLDALLALKKKA